MIFTWYVFLLKKIHIGNSLGWGYVSNQLSSFLMEHNLKLINIDGQLPEDATLYHKLIGNLMYLTIARPDIIYAINILSQFMAKPHKAHLDTASDCHSSLLPQRFPSSRHFIVEISSQCDSGGLVVLRVTILPPVMAFILPFLILSLNPSIESCPWLVVS